MIDCYTQYTPVKHHFQLKVGYEYDHCFAWDFDEAIKYFSKQYIGHDWELTDVTVGKTKFVTLSD